MKSIIRIGILFISCIVFLNSCSEKEFINDPVPGEVISAQIKSKARGVVPMQVFLPPEWDKSQDPGYPLIIFLHGQNCDEQYFFDNIDFAQLITWINDGEIPPFVLVSVASYYTFGNEQQWSTRKNEKFLTSDNERELRFFCNQNFNTSLDPGSISIHGHSRGARGALHYAFKYPEMFSSAMSDAFVSDYALEEEKQNALDNQDNIIDSGIKIRMVIGTEDEYGFEYGRRASYIMHDHLDSLNIGHEFEILEGINHYIKNIWDAPLENGISNGLYEMKIHASSWNN